jgi:hypothetical protein
LPPSEGGATAVVNIFHRPLLELVNELRTILPRNRWIFWQLEAEAIEELKLALAFGKAKHRRLQGLLANGGTMSLTTSKTIYKRIPA